jgi:hypothetical protein
MKKLLALVVAGFVLLGGGNAAWASDWDVAGKVLTGIEGMRILTGGRVDLIGSMTGINRNDRGRDHGRDREYDHDRGYGRGRGYRTPVRHYVVYTTRVWVPEYRWEKVWVPEKRTYDPHRGEVIEAGHFVSYKKEYGGHWEYTEVRR